MQQNEPQSESEEAFNAATHIIASLLFAYHAVFSDSLAQTMYASVFSLMFFSSFLYHIKTPWKQTFRTIDQFFIYVAIGASGVIVPNLTPSLHVVFFLSILGLTFVHHIMRQAFEIPEGLTIPFLYLVNGIICAYFLVAQSSSTSLDLYAGIALYVTGFVFYINDHKKYFHGIWHIMCALAAYLIYCHLSILS